MRPQSGFTLVETLISLMVNSLVILGFFTILESLSQFKIDTVERQNTMGIIQLRQVLSLGRSFTFTEDEVCMEFQTNETCFYETNQHLIQTPGTQIYLIDISNLEFDYHNKILSIRYTSHEKEYDKQLLVIRN